MKRKPVTIDTSGMAEGMRDILDRLIVAETCYQRIAMELRAARDGRPDVFSSNHPALVKAFEETEEHFATRPR